MANKGVSEETPLFVAILLWRCAIVHGKNARVIGLALIFWADGLGVVLVPSPRRAVVW